MVNIFSRSLKGKRQQPMGKILITIMGLHILCKISEVYTVLPLLSSLNWNKKLYFKKCLHPIAIISLYFNTKLYIPSTLNSDLVFWQLNCGCSKIINHRSNHGLFLSLFNVFGWKCIQDWIENWGLKSRMLYCLRFHVCTWCPR